MRKWLRGWFAWRFSLRRLVIATVVLGVVVGLNFREIGPVVMQYREARGGITVVGFQACAYYGWPFPFRNAYSDEELYRNYIKPFDADRETTSDDAERAASAWWAARWDAASSFRFPMTHQTYRLLGVNWGRLTTGMSIICATIDVLFALAVLVLILFLQISRRQAPVEG